MCSIIGALIWDASSDAIVAANAIVRHISRASFERGRDGRGFHVHEYPAKKPEYEYSHKYIERATSWDEREFFNPMNGRMLAASLIGNFRAEPTTEYVLNKHPEDQQPYRAGDWTIVHNGTIANDKELRDYLIGTEIDSAAIAELLNRGEQPANDAGSVAKHFADCVALLKGSYAILAQHAKHPGLVLAACNYRPLWFAATTDGVFFASSRDYFPDILVPQMLEPYSIWAFAPNMRSRIDDPKPLNKRALVVCSGGMDSVVATAWAIARGYEVVLLHFRYGSRAGGPEEEAIWKIRDHFKVGVWFQELNFYAPEDSALLRKDDMIAGGEAGAEFAHEWVPARNLVMLSIATAIAEARGLDTIVLGNNLEEAGAYPDNEPEFIARFNDMLPFAVGDGKKVQVIMPVGNMMKHEIVALGLALDAPLHLTWSCYRAGKLHCGKCGPCHMRRTAFEINKANEVIQYEGN